MVDQNLFQMIFKGRELVAESGDWGLFETVFDIEPIGSNEGELITITPQKLLPSFATTPQFVLISEAVKLTGFSSKELRRLYVDGKIVAKKISGRWVILLKSLDNFLKDSR